MRLGASWPLVRAARYCARHIARTRGAARASLCRLIQTSAMPSAELLHDDQSIPRARPLPNQAERQGSSGTGATKGLVSAHPPNCASLDRPVTNTSAGDSRLIQPGEFLQHPPKLRIPARELRPGMYRRWINIGLDEPCRHGDDPERQKRRT